MLWWNSASRKALYKRTIIESITMKKQLGCLLTAWLLSASAIAEVKVSDAWVRLLPPSVTTTAAYMTIASDQSDELLSASSSVSVRTEVHQTSKVDGVMSMSEVAGVVVEPGSRLALKPGSYHIMLIDLKAPLKEGQMVELSLNFKQQGEVKVTAPVQHN